MTSLIFKFRDEFSLSNRSAWKDLCVLSHEYVGETNAFFDSVYRPIVSMYMDIRPAQYTDPDNRLQSLCDRLRAVSDLPIHVLFSEELTNINPLWQRVKDYQEELHADTAWVMPTLFNYFRIDFPEGTSEEKIQHYLNTLGDFLPSNPDDTGYLLQCAYLQDDPVALSGTVSEAWNTGANQAYFDDMHIVDGFPEPATTGITIVEQKSWFLTHPQLPPNQPTIVFHKGQDPDTIKNINPEAGCVHGTQILGVLIANPNDDDDSDPSTKTDYCRGIIPEAPVRLVSCLATGTILKEDGGLDKARYAQELAVLGAINVTKNGETILIEVGTGGGGLFPLDVLPAVYELIEIAYHLHITVVAGSGNRSAILNTGHLMPRDVRATINSNDSEDETDNYPTHWQVYRQWERVLAQNERLRFASFPSVNAFLRHYQETPSKAILAGAAFRSNSRSNSNGAYELQNESSRGDRVQVFAQGNDILTITPEVDFYADMGDTSAAAAIIAGIVVLAQSVAKTKGKLIPPDVLYDWLRDNSAGIVPKGFPDGMTGVIPDVKEIRNKLNGWL